MSYRMACDNADLVASIASLAGATFANPSACSPSEPVHVLQIHGTADDVIDYDGSCFGPFCYPGALQSILTWSNYNQCSGDLENKESLDLVGVSHVFLHREISLSKPGSYIGRFEISLLFHALILSSFMSDTYILTSGQ